MAEISAKEYEKKMAKDALIIGLIGVTIVVILTIWGIKILLGI